MSLRLMEWLIENTHLELPSGIELLEAVDCLLPVNRRGHPLTLLKTDNSNDSTTEQFIRDASQRDTALTTARFKYSLQLDKYSLINVRRSTDAWGPRWRWCASSGCSSACCRWGSSPPASLCSTPATDTGTTRNAEWQGNRIWTSNA